MISKSALSTVFIVLIKFSAVGQQKSKFAFGIQTDIGINQVQSFNLDHTTNGDEDFGGGDIPYGYRIGGVVQYSSLKFLGFRSGVLFQQRNYSYTYRDYSYQYGTRTMFMASVPLLIQIKTPKVFTFNMGADVNFYLGKKTQEAWESLQSANYKVADVALYVSFEFTLYHGLSAGFGASWGVTPFAQSIVPDKYVDNKSEPYVYYHRGLFLNLQYLFNQK